MLKRIITAIVALLVLIPILVFSDTWVMPIALSLCTLIAVYEAMKCTGLHKNAWVVVPLYAVALWMPISGRLLGAHTTLEHLVVIFVALLIYLFAVAIFAKGKLIITEIAMAFMLTLYIVFSFCSILFLRDMEGIGRYLYLLAFIGAWITDTMAYFTGMLLGRHKLIPEVSPKKTVEGAIGGIVFGALSFLGYGLILQSLEKLVVSNAVLLLICGALIALVAQIGDLAMSFLKRHYKIKDFGTLFPGHGGVLDRFDSVLAVASVLFIAFTYLSIFEGL